MAVSIRLRRMGAKKRPEYAVVAADQRCPRDGRYLEKLGNYYPLREKDRFVINKERVTYWLQQGAQPTDRIKRLLAQMNIGKYQLRNRSKKHLPKAKAQQRLADLEAAKAKPEAEATS